MRKGVWQELCRAFCQNKLKFYCYNKKIVSASGRKGDFCYNKADSNNFIKNVKK